MFSSLRSHAEVFTVLSVLQICTHVKRKPLTRIQAAKASARNRLRRIFETQSVPSALSHVGLGRCSLPAQGHSRLRLDCSAHPLSVQFAAFEKFEYLVCGQREIFTYGEDYLPIGGLQRETHSHPMLPQ
jgi:hypothetical protein